MLDLLISNPWRPVDAWWQRATGNPNNLRATVNRDGARGCGWIRKTQRFLHALREAETFDERVHVHNEFAPLHWAHILYHQTADNFRLIRSGVEARILARETNEQIARRIGGWADTIEAYESLFFNVRGRLDYSDFILNGVIGEASARGQATDRDWLWKLLGYLAGPHLLDALIGHFPNPMRVKREEDVPAFFQDSAISLMKKKASISALSVPVDSHTQLHLLESFVKFVEVERTTDSAGGAQDQIQEGLQELINSLPYATIGVHNVDQLPDFDTGAAELRNEELLLMNAGFKIPGIELLQNLKFPEPAAKP